MLQVNNPTNLAATEATLGLVSKETTQVEARDIIDTVYEALSRLEFLQTAKNSDGSLRVTALAGTITTVSTVSNLTNFNGYDSKVMVPANSNVCSVLSNINNIVVT